MSDSSFFSRIQKPGRYLGSEYNSSSTPWENAELRCALLFPDLYEIGMSHQGLQILYHILNGQDSFLAERCYCPDKDAEKLLNSSGKPLCSLESGRPLADFDLMGITLPYELCYTNIFTMLNLANIPFFAKERDDSYPLIIGGGSCALNPEPVADLFDLILNGDGEEAIVDIAKMVNEAKISKLGKRELLGKLAAIEGVYLPSRFEPVYGDSDRFSGITAKKKQDAVNRRILSSLDDTDYLTHPIVPNAKIVHDRYGVEIARGCTRGCRFCQAGITYRPVRERSPEQVVQLAKEGIDNSGFNELALLSLSTGDYSCLNNILPELMDSFADNYVSVAMPSMRVGTLTPDIMDQIKRVRKTGFTLAPEAGSERLRRVINKGITEEDLLDTCNSAFSLGWKVLKFYFMIGLPTETDEDIDAIIELIKKVQYVTKDIKGKKQVTVSIGTFVPKPHTPFQWDRQLSISESRERIFRLKDNLPRKNCSLKFHNPEMSYLEGVFSRGDRQLSRLLLTAWQNGARLDGWSDHFNFNLWLKSAQELEVDMDDYLRERKLDEALPWSHLMTGVEPEFLVDEREKAFDEVYTPDCRYHGCQQCGLCDFEHIQPIVYGNPFAGDTPKTVVKPVRQEETRSLPPAARDIPAHEEQHIKYMVHYSRKGNICYLGHLEILQLIFRALRRADITTNFSKGFNPSPKITFGPALPVGTRSEAEYFIMDLPAHLPSTAEGAKRLSENLPPGMEVISIELYPGKLPQTIYTRYQLVLPKTLSESEKKKLKSFMALEEFVISRTRKNKTRQYNIRPLILSCIQSSEKSLDMELLSQSGSPGIKPIEALQHIFELSEEQSHDITITKLSWQAIENH